MSQVSGTEELTLRSGFTLVIDVSHGSLAGHKLCHCLQFPFITASTDHPGWQHNSFGDQYGHGKEKALKCCHLRRGRTLIFLLMQYPAETCLSLKAGDGVLLACRQVVDIKACFMPKMVDFTKKRKYSWHDRKHTMRRQMLHTERCFSVHTSKMQVLPRTQSSFWSGGGFPAVHHFQLWQQQQQQQQANRTRRTVVSHLHVYKRANIH